MSRTQPGLEWTKRHARTDHIEELRGLLIGPAFPADPDHRPGMDGTRRANRGGKDTKPPYTGPRRKRHAPDGVTAACLSCRWSMSGSTWRPVKRRLAEHVGRKHPRLVAAVDRTNR